MIVYFVSFSGNMEFDVVNTPCPGYKTLKRRYTILVFPRVNIKLTQKQNMVKQEKIFCNIELTKKEQEQLGMNREFKIEDYC